MISLIKYNTRMYLASNKFVMPALIYFLFLAMYYCATPKTIVTSFSLSIVVLYMLMVWIGFGYSDCEDRIAEQIMILKTKNILKYYSSKLVFLFVIGSILSLLGVMVPIVWGAVLNVSGSVLFSHTVNGVELQEFMSVQVILQAFIFHIIFAYLGGALGYFFNPRLFKNRKIAVVIAMMIGIMGFLKGPVAKDTHVAVIKIVTNIFPPVSDFMAVCSECTESYPSFASLASVLIVAVMYSLALSVISIVVIKKKGF